MGTETKKVRITSQGWVDGMERYFPHLKVGDTIDVEENPEYEHEYFITGSIYVIPKTDCEIVTDEPELDDDLKEITAHDELKTEEVLIINDGGIKSDLKKNNTMTIGIDYDDEELRQKWKELSKPTELKEKLQKPTDTSHSEKIEITVDGQTYYINRKAWTLEKELRQYRNQLFDGAISQEVYDLLIETLLP